MDGQEISIFIDVTNIGLATPTLNEDLILNLYEGEPRSNPIQIMCRQVIIGLEPGQTKQFVARWRVPVGQTQIYAEVAKFNMPLKLGLTLRNFCTFLCQR